MEPISIGFIISAFVAGLITFLAPCTLPLVPGYLGFISGVRQEDLNDPEQQSAIRRRIILNGLFFVGGFTLVFVLFGALAGLLGTGLAAYREWFARIGGLFVILFGLFMLGVFDLKILQGTHRMKMPTWLEVGKPSSSLLIGGAFAFGWTPCVGPILGSILLLASSQTTVVTGALLLLVFSLGLAVPFMLVAWGFSEASAYIAKMQGVLKWISIVGGVFLVLLGILLISDNFALLLEFGFRLLGGTGYEELILDFL